jgi:uncharacterized phage protein (TIGR02220 family)
MANPWFRLWVDMVNDPKWRTIARKSNNKIGDVISVYLHMLTTASNATERGRTQGWCDEDVATALDLDVENVVAIREEMQGRVLDGDYVTGWEKRQPKREDSSAERSRIFREEQKKKREQTQPNATERKNALDTDTEEIRRDKNIKTTVPQSETLEVFDYWKLKHNHEFAKLDGKREKAIKARLKDGYTVGQLCKAIDGCKIDPFSQGQNERKTVYDDIELICRTAAKVDHFILIEKNGVNDRSFAQQKTFDALDAYMEKHAHG